MLGTLECSSDNTAAEILGSIAYSHPVVTDSFTDAQDREEIHGG